MNDMNFRPRAVLPDEVYNDIELCWFYCAKITGKTEAQSIIVKLGQLYPLDEHLHLKRATTINKELHVLIKPVSDCDKDLVQILESLVPISSSIGHVFTLQVPKYKPLTRKQFLQTKTCWSCSFHEDKRLEKSILNENFLKEEIEIFHGYMQLAIKEKLKAFQAGVANPVGAVIVSQGEVIASGHTKPHHPLKHAVMECIDEVARVQGGGKMDMPSLLQTEQKNVITTTKDGSFVKKAKMSEAYLCIGCDVFTTLEPCLMCSMALVHSRIKRVFYSNTDDRSGGLGSIYKIHCNTLINHNFEVYSCNEK